MFYDANKPLASLLRKALPLLLAMTLGGCATWTYIDTVSQEGPGGNYRIEAPVGWVRYNKAKESLVITRDGLPIQHIQIVRQSDEDFFKNTKLKLPAHVLPSDLAQMVIAEMRTSKTLLNLVIKENVPFTVAGQPGFKVHFQYRDERGTLFDHVVLGTAKDKDVVVMIYHALDTYYFARDLDTFYRVAVSFRF